MDVRLKEMELRYQAYKSRNVMKKDTNNYYSLSQNNRLILDCILATQIHQIPLKHDIFTPERQENVGRRLPLKLLTGRRNLLKSIDTNSRNRYLFPGTAPTQTNQEQNSPRYSTIQNIKTMEKPQLQFQRLNAIGSRNLKTAQGFQSLDDKFICGMRPFEQIVGWQPKIPIQKRIEIREVPLVSSLLQSVVTQQSNPSSMIKSHLVRFGYKNKILKAKKFNRQEVSQLRTTQQNFQPEKISLGIKATVLKSHEQSIDSQGEPDPQQTRRDFLNCYKQAQGHQRREKRREEAQLLKNMQNSIIKKPVNLKGRNYWHQNEMEAYVQEQSQLYGFLNDSSYTLYQDSIDAKQSIDQQTIHAFDSETSIQQQLCTEDSAIIKINRPQQRKQVNNSRATSTTLPLEGESSKNLSKTFVIKSPKKAFLNGIPHVENNDLLQLLQLK